MKKASDKLKNNYVVIQSWMVRELELKGNAAIIYALIYGFSQSEGQVCTCGDEYMAAWIGSSTRAVINIKNGLLSAGLIEKVEGFDGDNRYSGYRVVRSKISEKSSHKSLQILNETSEKNSHNGGKKYVKKVAKIGEVFSEIGEDFSPDNKLYINNNIYPVLSDSLSACAREDETDGLTEKEFYASNILSRLDVLDDPYKSDYEQRLKDIVEELKQRETVYVNGMHTDTTKVLKAMVDLFRDPQNLNSIVVEGHRVPVGLRDLVFIGNKASVKKKFNYTVAALFNAARQF